MIKIEEENIDFRYLYLDCVMNIKQNKRLNVNLTFPYQF